MGWRNLELPTEGAKNGASRRWEDTGCPRHKRYPENSELGGWVRRAPSLPETVQAFPCQRCPSCSPRVSSLPPSLPPSVPPPCLPLSFSFYFLLQILISNIIPSHSAGHGEPTPARTCAEKQRSRRGRQGTGRCANSLLPWGEWHEGQVQGVVSMCNRRQLSVWGGGRAGRRLLRRQGHGGSSPPEAEFIPSRLQSELGQGTCFGQWTLAKVTPAAA